MRYVLLVLLGLAPVAGTQVLNAQVAPSPGQQTMLSPGDSVRIVVWQQPNYSGDFVIAPDGSITHPMLRAIKVAGVPLATAESNLRKYLTENLVQNPQFVMEPLLRVAVMGEVPRPLVFAVQPATSIAQAIARAGGTNQYGERRRIRVIRSDQGGSQRVLMLNLEDPADRLSQSPVQSGDQIVVDRKRNFFRDLLMPAIGIVGSVASLGLLIDRVSRD